MTNFSLYNASMAAADKYKQAEAVFRAYVATMPSFMPTEEYYKLKTARDKARKAWEKAEKEWKREYARSQNNEK